MATILRRRKLGRTSCREIAKLSTTGIKVVRNDLAEARGGIIFRWGCTSNVFDADMIVNNSHAIHKVSDKAGFRRVLRDVGLCPETWFEGEVIPDGVLEAGLIVRPKTHSRGRHVYLVRTPDELRGAAIKCGVGRYMSRYIHKVAEYRVFVVQGRVVSVANKVPDNPDAVAWNVAQGGEFNVVKWDDWPLKAVRVALEAHAISNLDFSGVDVMVDAEGGAYVLEINSAPSLTSPYRQQCMAKAFDYIVKNGKEVIPLVDELGGYLKFIHPAICDRALIRGE